MLAALALGGAEVRAQSEPDSAAEAPAEEPAVDPLVEEAEALWSGWEARRGQVEALRHQSSGRTGDDLLVLEEKIWTKQLEGLGITRELTDNVLAQEQEGIDASRARARISDVFERGVAGFERHFAWRDQRVEGLRKERQDAEGRELSRLEKRLTAEQDRFQIALTEFARSIDAMESLDLEPTDARAELVSRLTERAEDLSGRLDLDRTMRETLKERLEREPGSTELQTEVEDVDETFSRRERNLSATIALMNAAGLETSAYQQILIQATGELSTGIFDRAVATGLLRSWVSLASARLAERGPVWAMKVLLFAFTLVVFWVLSVIASRILNRVVRSARVDISTLLSDTLVGWSSRIVLLIGLLVGLSQIGVQIAPLLAGLGIAGFIVGFALQDSLANFAAGAMILFYRPYDVDDVIETGAVRGRVSHMNLVSTTILTFDNQTLIVPNKKIWGDVIRNVTAQSARRIDLIFRVGYGEDVERIEKLFGEILAANDKVLDEPAAQVRLHQLGEFAVEFTVQPWVRREEYWDTHCDITRAVKLCFDREGSSAPKPQRELVVHP